jgi:conjugative transfer region protein TrbK
MTRKEDGAGIGAARQLSSPKAIRCAKGSAGASSLARQAASDTECLRVWAETRDRFLGRAPRAPPPAPEGR